MSKLAAQFHPDIKTLGPFQIGFAAHYFKKESWKQIDPQTLRAGELLANVLPGAIESEVTPRSEKAVEDLMKALEGSRPSQLSFFEGIRILSENLQVLEGVDCVLSLLFAPKLGVSSLLKSRHTLGEILPPKTQAHSPQAESHPSHVLPQHPPVMGQWNPGPSRNDAIQSPNSAPPPGYGFQVQPYGMSMPYYGPPTFPGQYSPVPVQYGPQYPYPPPFYPPISATQQSPYTAPAPPTSRKRSPDDEADAAPPARRRREDRPQADGPGSEEGADDTNSIKWATTPQAEDNVKSSNDALEDKRSDSDDSIIVIARPRPEQDDLVDDPDYSTDSPNSGRSSPINETTVTNAQVAISASEIGTRRTSQISAGDFYMAKSRAQRNGSLGEVDARASSFLPAASHSSDMNGSVLRSRVLSEPRPVRSSSLISPNRSLDMPHEQILKATRRSGRVSGKSSALAPEEHNVPDHASSNGSDNYDDRSVSDNDQIEQSSDEDMPVVRASRRERKLTEKGRELPKFLPKKKRLSSPIVQGPPSKIVRLSLPSGKLLRTDQSENISALPKNSLAARYLQGMVTTDNTKTSASVNVGDGDNQIETVEDNCDNGLGEDLLAPRSTRSSRPRLAKSRIQGDTMDGPSITKSSLRSRKSQVSYVVAGSSSDVEGLDKEVSSPAVLSKADLINASSLNDQQGASTGADEDHLSPIGENDAEQRHDHTEAQIGRKPDLTATATEAQDTSLADSSLLVWASIAADWSDSPDDGDNESSESEHEFQGKIVRALENYAARLENDASRTEVPSAPPAGPSKEIRQESSATSPITSVSAPTPIANQYQNIQRDFTAAYPPMSSQPQWPPHYYGNQYWPHSPAQYQYTSPYGPAANTNQGSYGFSQMPPPQAWPAQPYPGQNGYDGRQMPFVPPYSPPSNQNNGPITNQALSTSPMAHYPQNYPAQYAVPIQPTSGQGMPYPPAQYVAPSPASNGHVSPTFSATVSPYFTQPDQFNQLSSPYMKNGPALAPATRVLAPIVSKATPPAFSAASDHRRNSDGLIPLASAPVQPKQKSSGKQYKELRIKRIDTPGSISSSKSSATTSRLQDQYFNSMAPITNEQSRQKARNASAWARDEVPGNATTMASPYLTEHGGDSASVDVHTGENGINKHDVVVVAD